MTSLKKNVLIIGGTSGLGYSIYRDLSTENKNDVFIIGKSNRNNLSKENFLSIDISTEDFMDKVKKNYINISHFDLIIHCASPYGEDKVPNAKEMHDFYRVNVFSFWQLVTHFIENKMLIENSIVISVGSTAALKQVDYFNPAYVLAKNSLMQSSDIFQERFFTLGIKFCHIVLGSLGQDLVLHSDIMKYIHFLNSVSNGCFPTRIILKSKTEFS
ncbi:SDR family NAD(P)-dependent oxidoreductase [Fluviispira vulneris]|uniref:SDR family NAD(P)-dependent oxidoreductase n=1 Tax=Fluviispira vulneris TaxID=2763012 RepID=UPI001648568E|nr:SDR family NAD(P)-dependent oxidoreductase [Fluviispira vulneris]